MKTLATVLLATLFLTTSHAQDERFARWNSDFSLRTGVATSADFYAIRDHSAFLGLHQNVNFEITEPFQLGVNYGLEFMQVIRDERTDYNQMLLPFYFNTTYRLIDHKRLAAFLRLEYGVLNTLMVKSKAPDEDRFTLVQNLRDSRRLPHLFGVFSVLNLKRTESSPIRLQIGYQYRTLLLPDTHYDQDYIMFGILMKVF